MSTTYVNFLAVCALVCAAMTVTGIFTKNGEAVTVAGLVMLATVVSAWIAGKTLEAR